MKRRSVFSLRRFTHWLVAVVTGGSCLAVLADEPIHLQISDVPLPVAMTPTLMDPAVEHARSNDVEPLPPVIANTPAYSQGVVHELGQASQVLDTLHRELQQTDEEVARQFSRMQEGLDRLDDRFRTQTARQQELLQQMNAARRAAEQAAAQAANERQRMAALLSEPPWKNDATEETGPERDPFQPGPSSTGDLPAAVPREPIRHGQETAEPPTPERLPDEAPVPLLHTTVDRLRLADSLYGAGQFDVAVRIYAELANHPELKRELPWLFLQLAGCYRHLGDAPEAARYYRMVAGMQPDRGFGDTARWWLRHLEQRQALQQGLQAIRTAVSSPDG